MPEFVNPFSGKIPDRKLTKEELIRALRLDIAAEEEAVHLYKAQADATDDERAKKILIDIANEEIVHVGEFQKLLVQLSPEEVELLNKGAGEVVDKVGIVGVPESKVNENNDWNKVYLTNEKETVSYPVLINKDQERLKSFPSSRKCDFNTVSEAEENGWFIDYVVEESKKGNRKMNIFEAKDLDTYKKLLKVLGEYSDKFPGTGVSQMFDQALTSGKKILPKDKLAIEIIHHLLKTNSVASAIHKILNLRFSNLPIELRPLVKNGRSKQVAHWTREALVSDKIKDLIDWSGLGKKGYWSDTDGEKVKLHDLTQEEKDV